MLTKLFARGFSDVDDADSLQPTWYLRDGTYANSEVVRFRQIFKFSIALATRISVTSSMESDLFLMFGARTWQQMAKIIAHHNLLLCRCRSNSTLCQGKIHPHTHTPTHADHTQTTLRQQTCTTTTTHDSNHFETKQSVRERQGESWTRTRTTNADGVIRSEGGVKDKRGNG